MTNYTATPTTTHEFARNPQPVNFEAENSEDAKHWIVNHLDCSLSWTIAETYPDEFASYFFDELTAAHKTDVINSYRQPHNFGHVDGMPAHITDKAIADHFRTHKAIFSVGSYVDFIGSMPDMKTDHTRERDQYPSRRADEIPELVERARIASEQKATITTHYARYTEESVTAGDAEERVANHDVNLFEVDATDVSEADENGIDDVLVHLAIEYLKGQYVGHFSESPGWDGWYSKHENDSHECITADTDTLSEEYTYHLDNFTDDQKRFIRCGLDSVID